MLNLTTTEPTASSIAFCEQFMHAVDRYAGRVYLGKVGRFMLLVKSGSESILEAERLVKPITSALEAASYGLCAGAEKTLWTTYRQMFGKQAEIEGVWSAEKATKAGGVQVHCDYDVFMYPRPAVTTIDGEKTVVHGEHCAIRFNGAKIERLESTMYEPYREGETKLYNDATTRALNESELQKEAAYYAARKPRVFGSCGDRLHDLRVWLEDIWSNGDGEGQEYDMLDTLEERASLLFREASQIKRHVVKAEARVKAARGRTRQQLGRDLIDLDAHQRNVYQEAMTTLKLREHLETLIVDRLNGGFEEQNFEFGGQVREVCNMWRDAFDMRDMSYTERIHHHYDLREKVATN